MLSDDQLLFVKNKGENSFSDKTRECETLYYDGSQYHIVYNNNPKSYPYPQNQVAICTYKNDVDLSDYIVINQKSNSYKILKDVEKAGFYESNNPEFKGAYSITFKGNETCYIYQAAQLSIKRHAHAYPLFNYLYEICNAIKPTDVEDSIREYLPKQFNGMGTLDGTPAACLIDPQQNKPETCDKNGDPIIYPFGSNLSQMRATDNALHNQLSIIEGPPGTGKTQTILNIIANLVIQNKTALVVSPNNEATKNVYEKLVKEGYGFLVAPLGKKENRDAFKANQPEYPDTFSQWDHQESMAEIKELIRTRSDILTDAYKKQQNLASLRTELSEWELQYEHFLFGYSDFNIIAARSRTTVPKIKELRGRIAESAIEDQPLDLSTRLQARFLWGIGKWENFSILPVDLEISLNRTIFQLRIDSLKRQINELQTDLNSIDAKSLVASVTEWSQSVFQSSICRKYQTGAAAKSRVKFDNPWKTPNEFRAEYPIITSTTNAARNQIGKDGELFDYVIIDESSQADLVTGMLALSSAKNAVIVGDINQLPCVITDEEKWICEPIEKKHSISEPYSYTKQSLLSCLTSLIENGSLVAPRQLLKEHYRCHSKIIGFCNQMFYNNELIIMSDDSGIQPCEALYLSPTKDCNYDNKMDYNRQQAGQFYDDVLPFFKKYEIRSEIGVATPYRAQADGMKKDAKFEGIEIDTVHKYQGREKNSIAFITRSNWINKFINNPNLINVAVSRAKNRFALIASPQVLCGTNNIADLARYIGYHDGSFVESSVSSSFDLLYGNYKNEKEQYLAARNASGDQYSEIQTKEWINTALDELNCNTQIGYLRNYPLKQFLIDLSPFDKEEKRFINTRAHADFLFYRKSDKSILFDLEVNGSQHDYPEQKKRDQTKTSLLSKVDIPLEILRTNEYDPKKYVFGLIKKYFDPNESKTTIKVAVKDKDNPWDDSVDRAV